jgi:hypothetical protein
MVRFVASKVPYFHQRKKRLVYQLNICFYWDKIFLAHHNKIFLIELGEL